MAGSAVDSSVLGGWVRAGVASGLAILIAKAPGLSSILTPDVQAAIGAAAAGIVVGAWSHIAKANAAH